MCSKCYVNSLQHDILRYIYLLFYLKKKKTFKSQVSEEPILSRYILHRYLRLKSEIEYIYLQRIDILDFNFYINARTSV